MRRIGWWRGRRTIVRATFGKIKFLRGSRTNAGSETSVFPRRSLSFGILIVFPPTGGRSWFFHHVISQKGDDKSLIKKEQYTEKKSFFRISTFSRQSVFNEITSIENERANKDRKQKKTLFTSKMEMSQVSGLDSSGAEVARDHGSNVLAQPTPGASF